MQGIGSQTVIVADNMLAFTPTNTSTPMRNAKPNKLTANLSIITPAHKSIAYNAVTTSYKAITATATRIIHASDHISISKPTIVPAYGTIDSTNPKITSKANISLVSGIIIKLMRSASTDMLTTTLTHTPVSAPASARNREQLLQIVVCISMILITAC